MKTRIISSIILLPLVFLVMAVGGPALYATLCLATLLGFYEFFRAVKMTEKAYIFIASAHGILTYIFYWSGHMDYLYMLNILMILLMLAFYALKFPKVKMEDLAYTFFAIFYILFLMLSIAFVRDSAYYGNWMIWLIFAIAFGSDSSAYFVGVNLGKHKLVPKLSPNKTIEGAIGGLLGAGIIALIFGIIMYVYGPFTSGLQVGFMFVIGLVGSVISQIGDLVGSAMKRHTGIKDFGKTIPGHGGILDRLDSILVTAAYIYVIQTILTTQFFSFL